MDENATHFPPGTNDEVSVTRSEEELVVTTRPVEVGRVRLLKRIVTEVKTYSVQVRREELELQHHDAPTAAASHDAIAAQTPRADGRGRAGLSALQGRARTAIRGAALLRPGSFADETVDVALMEEEVVITKRIVPRERVRLRKHTVHEELARTDEVRSERVELEDVTTPAATTA